MADAWGGSWGVSWGDSWGATDVVVPPATSDGDGFAGAGSGKRTARHRIAQERPDRKVDERLKRYLEGVSRVLEPKKKERKRRREVARTLEKIALGGLLAEEVLPIPAGATLDQLQESRRLLLEAQAAASQETAAMMAALVAYYEQAAAEAQALLSALDDEEAAFIVALAA